MSDTKVIKLKSWIATTLTFIIALLWALLVTMWHPSILFAPLIVILSYLTLGLRTRAAALRWAIVIPASRFDDKLTMESTVAHESRHISDQKYMGFLSFLLKWLTPSGCVHLESRGYAENIHIKMERTTFISVSQKDNYFDRIIIHYANVIKRSYPQVKWSSITIREIQLDLIDAMIVRRKGV